ncbi:geranylgeranyl reductase family protein [Hydrogenobaculum acidophilum]
MERYDVIVIGGGPAGAGASYELADAGAKVLVLEKAKYPRPKLCAGCISKRSIHLFPDFNIKNTIKGGILGFKGEVFVEKKKDECAVIVDREEFDYVLISKAQEKGAKLLEETTAKDIELTPTVRKVITDKGIFEADYIIGADGYHSITRKSIACKDTSRKFFMAMEVRVPKEDLKDFPDDEVLIDIGVVKRGYGWYFPQGEFVNIGIATAEKEDLLNIFKNYAKNHKLFPIDLSKYRIKSWFIPFTSKAQDLRLGRDRVFLTGDAGAMVDPLLGEGIRYAYLSGSLSARAIKLAKKDANTLYERFVKNTILEDLVYAGKIASIVYNIQELSFKLSQDKALYMFFELLKGEKTYKDLYRWGWKELIKNIPKIAMKKI